MIEFVIPCSGELCEARTLEDAREYFTLFNYTADQLAEVLTLEEYRRRPELFSHLCVNPETLELY